MFLRSGGDVGGHAEGDGEAERGAEHGVGDAGVAAGGVEQAAASALVELSRPRFSASSDDGGGGAVLDGAAGVGPLGLAEDLDAGQVAVSRSRRTRGVLPMRSSRVAPSDWPWQSSKSSLCSAFPSVRRPDAV